MSLPYTISLAAGTSPAYAAGDKFKIELIRDSTVITDPFVQTTTNLDFNQFPFDLEIKEPTPGFEAGDKFRVTHITARDGNTTACVNTFSETDAPTPVATFNNVYGPTTNSCDTSGDQQEIYTTELDTPFNEVTLFRSTKGTAGWSYDEGWWTDQDSFTSIYVKADGTTIINDFAPTPEPAIISPANC